MFCDLTDLLCHSFNDGPQGTLFFGITFFQFDPKYLNQNCITVLQDIIFPFHNNPKDVDLTLKTNLDILGCLEGGGGDPII